MPRPEVALLPIFMLQSPCMAWPPLRDQIGEPGNPPPKPAGPPPIPLAGAFESPRRRFPAGAGGKPIIVSGSAAANFGSGAGSDAQLKFAPDRAAAARLACCKIN